MSESESDIRITTDTPYLALTVELWGVYCEDLDKIGRVITAPHCIWMSLQSAWDQPAVPEDLPPPSAHYQKKYQQYEQDMKQGYKDKCAGQKVLVTYHVWKCFNSLWPIDARWWHRSDNFWSVNGLLLDGAKPLAETILTCCQLDAT